MTTTSSATSGTISSLGIGSGLDANAIVTQLVALERQPITQLQTKATQIQAQISAFGQVQSAVSSLRDASRVLANPDIWSTTKATSADSNAVNFTTSPGATPGNYAVSVTALASRQTVVTNTALSAATSTLGSGTLTIETGTWSGNSLSASGSVNVSVSATDTLEDIRDKINGAGAGVTASLVKDASGVRLMMTSSATGAASGFRVTVDDTGDGNATDDAGLSALAYDPAAATAGTTRTQTASDAAVSVNGIAVTSSTNKFDDVLNGISFTVGKLTTTTVSDGMGGTTTTDSPINVQVAQDNDAITKAITDFATSYSSLISLLRDNTKYDDATKTAGTLQGDGTAVGILNQFRSLVGSNAGNSSTFSTLSSVGVEIQTGGALTVNSSKLSSSLSNLAEVKKLFANANLTDATQDGVATKLRTLSDTLLGFEGALTTRTAGLNQAVQDNQKRQDELDARSALYEKRLRAQYTALDQTMAGLNSQSSYVTQMITNMNKA